jgi:translation initiation factor IF-1
MGETLRQQFPEIHNFAACSHGKINMAHISIRSREHSVFMNERLL